MSAYLARVAPVGLVVGAMRLETASVALFVEHLNVPHTRVHIPAILTAEAFELHLRRLHACVANLVAWVDFRNLCRTCYLVCGGASLQVSP